MSDELGSLVGQERFTSCTEMLLGNVARLKTEIYEYEGAFEWH